ncbi:hypothetical protein CDN99_25595 [Roseateles aquatilis]|uniref:Uncharacterized protein n=1 Tax=Roseateles aquatilis TaxID=431061 RepID=A0A246IUF3_9BURK|nr:hypothetical protein [Roseateles aquatilis]OWQ83843.1 hypothetical protein CDN99_25595 [Roseateles aquatilis]
MLQNLYFGAGGRQIDAAASFFRYESGSAGGADESIRVRADGSDLGTYYPGDGIELPVQAGRWEIIPTSPNTTGIVRMGVGRVTSARLAGTVRVLDEITDSILSAAYQGPTAQTNFAVFQLVAPGANVNGMVLRMASCGGAAGAGGSTVARIVACKSAPIANFNPSQCYQVCENFSAVTTDNGTTVRMNKRLPPGWGLYLVWQIKTADPATGPSGVVQYELQ